MWGETKPRPRLREQHPCASAELIRSLRCGTSKQVRRLRSQCPSRPRYDLTGIYRFRYIPLVETAFVIIAEPNRRAILSLLASSDRSVSEIERSLRIPQPSVSKHLRLLREARLLAD